MKKVAVMVDSSSDLSPETAQQLGIHVLRMPVVIDDVSYIEQEELSIEEMSDALEKGKKVSTTQASPGRLEQVWDEVLQEYDQILFMPISNLLSGSNATAMSLALDEKYKDRVVVIQSRYVSYAQVHLMVEIKKLIDQGISLIDIKNRVENEIYEEAYFVPYDLNTFKNSGRIKPAVAALAGLLKIQVVLYFDREGKIEQFDKVRTLSKAYNIMLEEVVKVENFNDYHWGIIHSDFEEEAVKIKKSLEEKINNSVEITRIRAVIRAHTGNKTIGIYRINKLK